jgi:hypothetical protein
MNNRDNLPYLEKLIPGHKIQIPELVRENFEGLVKELVDHGIEKSKATIIADNIDKRAFGAVSHRDWMTLESERFSSRTLAALEKAGIKSDVSEDDKLAEKFTAIVFENEGIPNGNGDTDPVRKEVVFGQYDNKNHGIDLVAADTEGVPIVIEVKDYKNSNTVLLSDYSLKGEVNQPLEIPVQGLASERGRKFGDEGSLKNPLEIRQMNDLWVRDRWLKLIKRWVFPLAFGWSQRGFFGFSCDAGYEMS